MITVCNSWKENNNNFGSNCFTKTVRALTLIVWCFLRLTSRVADPHGVEKSSFLSGPTTKALPPPLPLELSGHPFFGTGSDLQEITGFRPEPGRQEKNRIRQQNNNQIRIRPPKKPVSRSAALLPSTSYTGISIDWSVMSLFISVSLSLVFCYPKFLFYWQKCVTLYSLSFLLFDQWSWTSKKFQIGN